MGQEYGGSAAAVVSNQASRQQQDLEAANHGRFTFRPLEVDKVTFQFLPEAQDSDASIRRRTVLGVAVRGAGGNAAAQLGGDSARIITSGTGSVAVLLTLSRCRMALGLTHPVARI